MGTLEVAAILLAWTGLFGLLVVVPWGTVRVVGGVLETNAEALVDRWTPSLAGSGREQHATAEVTMMDGGEEDTGLDSDPVRSDYEPRDG